MVNSRCIYQYQHKYSIYRFNLESTIKVTMTTIVFVASSAAVALNLFADKIIQPGTALIVVETTIAVTIRGVC